VSTQILGSSDNIGSRQLWLNRLPLRALTHRASSARLGKPASGCAQLENPPRTAPSWKTRLGLRPAGRPASDCAQLENPPRAALRPAGRPGSGLCSAEKLSKGGAQLRQSLPICEDLEDVNCSSGFRITSNAISHLSARVKRTRSQIPTSTCPLPPPNRTLLPSHLSRRRSASSTLSPWLPHRAAI
jgi:hypothetical protein